MFRVSATTLETYRLFRTQDWFDFERLKADWGGERDFDPIMVRGSSFHGILENWDEHKNQGAIIENNGWHWHKSQLEPIAQSEQLTGVAEVKGEAVMTLSRGEEITLVGIVDRLDSYKATEYKTTQNFATDKYANSVQWRIYCLIFGLQSVTYKVAHVDDNNPVNIKSFEQVTFAPYAGMQKEIEALLEEMLTFCLDYGFYRQIGIKHAA